MQATTHPVDEKLPAGKLFALGMQHVLVMYAGAIAVPLIIGGALHLPKDQIAFLINAEKRLNWQQLSQIAEQRASLTSFLYISREQTPLLRRSNINRGAVGPAVPDSSRKNS